jgi:hypothetical protein
MLADAAAVFFQPSDPLLNGGQGLLPARLAQTGGQCSEAGSERVNDFDTAGFGV